MNGMLAARANANREFFLNCVEYLSGTGNYDAGGVEAGVLSTGMDRGVRSRYLVFGSMAVPLSAFFVLFLASCGRRRSEA
jgi:hypothetical protein